MKTLTLQLGRSANFYRQELKKENVNISAYADELITKMPSNKREKVEVKILTVADLGFTSAPTTTELLARAKEKGYDLCSAEVGPALRLSYADQPNNEWLWIGMEPLPDSDGYPGVFVVGRDGDGGLWLDGGWADPDYRWRLDGRLVFRLRKSSDSTLASSEKHLDTLPLEFEINGFTYRRV